MAKVVAVKAVPSNNCVQPMRAHKPPTYLTQDQNKEVRRLRTSAAAATEASKQGMIPRMTMTMTTMMTRRVKRMTTMSMMAVRTSRGGRKGVAPMRRTGTARTVVRMMARMRGGMTMMTSCQMAMMMLLPRLIIQWSTPVSLFQYVIRQFSTIQCVILQFVCTHLISFVMIMHSVDEDNTDKDAR